YSQELRYITARDLARRLAEVFGSGADPSGMEDAGAPLMPGLEPTTIHEPGVDGAGGSFASIGGGASLDPSGAGGVSMTLRVDGDAVGISAVEENNTLLERANAAAWRSIRDAIHRLDVVPLQVHIEAQVAEVTLSGEHDHGLSWYLRNADGGTPTAPSNAGLRNLSASGLHYTFGVDNGIGIINALDQVSEVRMLQSPSVTVRNNHEATFTVGSKIPVASVSVNTIGAGDTVSQVQYL